MIKFCRPVNYPYLALLLLSFLLMLAPAHAQTAAGAQGTQPVGIGGITISQAPNLITESEKITISAQEVRAEYILRNYSGLNYEPLISFALPLQPVSFADLAAGKAPTDWTQFGYETHINDQPARLQIWEQAEASGRNVDADLQMRGWHARWWQAGDIMRQIEALSSYEKARMSANKLLIYNKADYSYYPGWNLKTSLLHQLRVDAGDQLKIVHRYAPLLGAEHSGPYRLSARLNAPEMAERAQATYCMDSRFWEEIDRRDQYALRKRKPLHSVTRLAYLLADGRAGAPPIGQFDLTVDAGGPDRLVAFCMNGIMIEDGQKWRVQASGFQPVRNLDILIFSWP